LQESRLHRATQTEIKRRHIRARRIASSEMVRRVALVRTDLSEEHRLKHKAEDDQRARNNVSCNYKLKHSAKKHSVLQLLVTTDAVPSSLILLALMKEAILSSKNLFLQEPPGFATQKMAFLLLILLSFELLNCIVQKISTNCLDKMLSASSCKWKNIGFDKAFEYGTSC
jgi:hypothetical protein